MSKAFDEKFDDSTPHTFYTVSIVSENGQRRTYKEVDDEMLVRDIYDLLEEWNEERKEWLKL